MESYYSIIIPIFNEEVHIPNLLKYIEKYKDNGHEIIIIDDGSTDESFKILSNCNFIKLIRFNNNFGKGRALRTGIANAKFEKLVIYDGDLELHPNQIKELMILDKNQKINCVLASRGANISPLNSLWDLGNFLITKLFNVKNTTNLEDALCCAKSFYKSDINVDNLKSLKFDIDVEISSMLIKKFKNIQRTNLNYHRRSLKDGKKLNFLDSIAIIKRILCS